jgi:hypothetical protein
MISDAELNQIEERARAATEGPWLVEDGALYFPGGGLLYAQDARSLADVRFIAAARTDVPALVAALREARAVVDAAAEVRRVIAGDDSLKFNREQVEAWGRLRVALARVTP